MAVFFFFSSVLAKNLNNRTLHFPPPASLPNFEQPLPYVFVGDEAFPLSNDLIRPYPKKMLQEITKIKLEVFLGKQIAFQEGNTRHLLTQIASPVRVESFKHFLHSE